MYHIPDDKRARRSAERLCRALLDNLELKDLHSITVSDLHQVSGVSRATFYRLFDTINDVVAYQCDRLYDDLSEWIRQNPGVSLRDISLELIRRWIALPRFMETLVKNNLIGVLFRAQKRSAATIWGMTENLSSLTKAEQTYFICTLIGMLPVMLHAWYINGQKDSPEEIYDYLKGSISTISDLMN